MLAGGELRGDVAVAHDGAGHELRKEGDVGGDVEVALRRLRITAIDIDEVARRLEDVEGDPDGKNHLPRSDLLPAEHDEEGAQAVDAEVEVLEVGEGADVQQDPGGECSFRTGASQGKV